MDGMKRKKMEAGILALAEQTLGHTKKFEDIKKAFEIVFPELTDEAIEQIHADYTDALGS